MDKTYQPYSIVGLIFCSFLIVHSSEKPSTQEKIESLKSDIIHLQQKRDNLLSIVQKELADKSKSSLFFLLNPVFILWALNFIKEPSIGTLAPFIPYLIIMKDLLPWTSSSQYKETVTSLITLESTIKKKREKIKKLKSDSIKIL